MNNVILIVKAIENQTDMKNADANKDQEILNKLEHDIQDWPKVVERNKKFGITLNSDSNILKRRTYSKFISLSKSNNPDGSKNRDARELSPLALEWMGDFVKNGPYDDVRQFINNHTWIHEYRKLKEPQ